MKEKGASTLRGRNIWFDSTVLRLNVDERGTLLGEFEGDERIIVFYKSGYFILLLPELSVHFEDDILLIEKVDIEQIFTIVYFDADKSFYYVKRFLLDEECSLNRPYNLVGDNSASKVLFIQTDKYPRIEIKFGGKNKNRANEIIDIEPFIGVKSFKAFGKRITNYEVETVTAIEPIVTEEEVESFIENELSQIKEPEFEVYDRDGKQIAIDF